MKKRRKAHTKKEAIERAKALTDVEYQELFGDFMNGYFGDGLEQDYFDCIMHGGRPIFPTVVELFRRTKSRRGE
jgi:hypothetical protein